MDVTIHNFERKLSFYNHNILLERNVFLLGPGFGHLFFCQCLHFIEYKLGPVSTFETLFPAFGSREYMFEI